MGRRLGLLAIGLAAALALGAGAWAQQAAELGPAWWAEMGRTTPAGSVTADGPRRVAAIEVQVRLENGVPTSVYVCCETGLLAQRAAELAKTWRYSPGHSENFRAMVAVKAQPGVPDLPFPARAQKLRITYSDDLYGILLMGGAYAGAGASVEIDQDGKVTYVQGWVPAPPLPPGTPITRDILLGGRGQMDNEKRAGQISPSELAQLIERFRAVDFYKLNGLYSQPAEHTPTDTVSLTMDGRTMTVADHGGGAPPPVLEIQQQIIALARKATGLPPLTSPPRVRLQPPTDLGEVLRNLPQLASPAN